MPPARRPTDPSQRVPRPGTGDGGRGYAPANDPALEVGLPAGGKLNLLNADEVLVWNEAKRKYIHDFRLTKTSDLISLGALLTQIVVLYRAQRELVDPKKGASAQAAISKAAEDIRKIEKSLGIDKATREKGGQQTVADYITRLKRAGYEKGVHVSNRVKENERVMMEARWKIRLLRNGDTEDSGYHRVTHESIIDWLEKELARLEEADKEWAKEKAALWVGKL